jgi:DNA replication protein DnaC
MACDRKQLEQCGVYSRYQEASFAAIEARGVPAELQQPVQSVREFAEKLPLHLAAGEGLVLRGPVGTLKTTLAVAVLQYGLQLGERAMFLTMPSLIDSIFSAKAVSPEDWLRFESRLRQVPLLVLDDLGAEWGSGYVMSKVDAIFAERYNRKRSTIVTTNLVSQALRSRYPDRIIDRLRETAQIITFNTRLSLRENCR